MGRLEDQAPRRAADFGMLNLYNAVTMALPSGTKLGPYEILAPLGGGGMVEEIKTLPSPIY
jgi:hypothetical protein